MRPAEVEKLRAALAAEDWDAAERVLRRAVARKDAAAADFYNLGLVLVRQGREAQAETMLRRALARDASHADAWCELGALLLRRHDLAAGEGALARAAALRPGDAVVRRDLARVRLRLGLWEAAARDWAAFPGDAEADAALLRIALETGAADAPDRRRAMAAVPARRAHLLKAITRTGRGKLPLRPGDL